MNEYCQLVIILIPKYIKRQCTEVERELLDVHCAGCPECRAKLARAKSEAQTPSVKVVLFLSRSKNLKTSQNTDWKETKQEAENRSNKEISKKTEDTDTRSARVPEQSSNENVNKTEYTNIENAVVAKHQWTDMLLLSF